MLTVKLIRFRIQLKLELFYLALGSNNMGSKGNK